MSRAPPSSTWEALGTSAFYKREEVYSMLWSLPPLSSFHSACARHGGPIALMPDPKKPVVSTSSAAHSSKRIDIYTSAGSLLQSIQLEPSSKVVTFGFDLAENLVVVYQDGFYRIHPLEKHAASPTYTQHSLGTEATETGVLDARMHESGFVFLTGSLAFFEVHWGTDITAGPSHATSQPSKTHVSKLSEPGLQEAPSVWSVVPPEDSLSRQTEVLVPVRQSLAVVDALDSQDQAGSKQTQNLPELCANYERLSISTMVPISSSNHPQTAASLH